MSTVEYVCALSGKAVTVEDDGDDSLPENWVRMTIQSRRRNPKWKMLQEMIEASVANRLNSVPAEAREAARPYIEMEVEATFHGYSDSIPEYIDEEEELTLLPTGEAREAYNDIRISLGLAKSEDGDLIE